jgi:hypothetical protein
MSIATLYHHVITKILVGAVIVLGSFVGLAAPAGASPASADPNPFGALRVSGRATAPIGGPTEEMNRGLRNGVGPVAALPAPARPSHAVA